MDTKTILVITDKVMPYRSAFYRQLSKLKEFNTKVLYQDGWGYDNAYDQTLNVNLSWDGPILEGFEHEFIKGKSVFKTRYTGADRVKSENVPIIGNIIYYIRVFIGVCSLQFINRLRTDTSDIYILEGCTSLNYIISILIIKLRGKKLVIRGESYLHGRKPFYIKVVKSIFLRVILPCFDLICYSCEENKAYYSYYGVKERKLVYVPSSVDHEYFAAARGAIKRNGNALRKKINTEGKIVFLAIGRFVKRKRWDDYLKALAGIEASNIISIFVGDGPLKATMKKIIENHNIENVYFEGFKNQSEISNYYDIADVLILPSDYDPTPKVLNEALEFGLPVLLSDTIGTAKELCVNNGYVFEKGNIEDLRAKIQLIISDNEKLREFSNNSLKLASEWSLQKGANNIFCALGNF